MRRKRQQDALLAASLGGRGLGGTLGGLGGYKAGKLLEKKLKALKAPKKVEGQALAAGGGVAGLLTALKMKERK